MKHITFALVGLLLLSGCITQDQADLKMKKGCIAGVEALIEPKEIIEITNKLYSDEELNGVHQRRITLEALEKDEWVDLEAEYSCLFAQEWGFFKSSHKALLVQIKIGDQIYGQKDGALLGSFNDFLKLNEVIDGVMEQ